MRESDPEKGNVLSQVVSLDTVWRLTDAEYAAAPDAEILVALLQNVAAVDLIFGHKSGLSEHEILDLINSIWLEEEAKRNLGDDARCEKCPAKTYHYNRQPEPAIRPTDEQVEKIIARAIADAEAINSGDMSPVSRIGSAPPLIKLMEELGLPVLPESIMAISCYVENTEGRCDYGVRLERAVNELKKQGASVVGTYLDRQRQALTLPRWRNDGDNDSELA